MQTKLRLIVLCALFAALTAVCSQIAIPLPFVPINLALLAVLLCGAVLGCKWGAASMLVYVLLGLLGAPVFAGFGAGAGVLFGKTGGYIMGYILAAALAGLLAPSPAGYWRQCAAMAVAVVACYALGTAWFLWVTRLPLGVSLTYCVWPFLPGDALKILLAAYLSGKLRPHINKMLGRK
ncbi:MAG: biotin transporter BioY [Christensenellaceae bacterium]|jgi:biotin transport system substrate-specific component|nr:biotin transporter BioY [Christensenellaceae bacterium]